MKCEICKHEVDQPLTVSFKGETHTFCCLSCLSHYYRPKDERVSIIEDLEAYRGTRLITMIHRLEEKNDQREYITIEDSEEILHQIRTTEQDRPLDFVMHCPGGLMLPAEQIAMAIRNYPSKVTVIIPHYAMSGATLVALAADEILMDAHSVLGPLDPQIQGIPAPILIKVANMKPIEYTSDNILIAAEIAKKALSRMRAFTEFLLRDKMNESKAQKVASFLTGGYMTHDTPITAKEAQILGLPVKIGLPAKMYALLRSYKFGKTARPSMFQIPCPCLPKSETQTRVPKDLNKA